MPTGFSTTNIKPIYRRLVAAAASFAPSAIDVGIAFSRLRRARARGEADPPLRRRGTRCPPNALGPISLGRNSTTRGR